MRGDVLVLSEKNQVHYPIVFDWHDHGLDF